MNAVKTALVTGSTDGLGRVVARALARPRGATVNSVRPATYMNATMARAMAVKPQSTVADGAAAVLHLACVPELAGTSGEFFDGLRPARANAQAYHRQARRRLATMSKRLAGLAPGGGA
jgi:NAD(P)-dependent dehydrogenase (short-subunit alcohol dehydrogenase family)